MTNSKQVTVIAAQKIGKYKPNDEITTDKYTARTLVAYGRAKFKNPEDDFRRPHPTSRKKRTRREYSRRDMVAEQ